MVETINNTMMGVLLATTGNTGGTAGGNSSFITEFFNGVAKYVKAVGSYLVVLAGIALIIASVYMLAKAFISRGGTNWVVVIACLLTGGILAIGGWTMITGTDGAKGELGGIAKGTMDELFDGADSAAVGDFNDSGNGNGSTIDSARHGLYIISSQFILPFGKALAICTGVALIVYSIFNIATFFFAGGRMQTSWLKLAAMCLIGSVLFAGTPSDKNAQGWTWMRDMIGGSTKDTIINMSSGEPSEADPMASKRLDEFSDGNSSGNNVGADPADVPG